ncbi:hypothetical protein HanPSC8_Chr11g0489471 [Helianthus annuus]|nr:hypothetical protein HanPSC8_Chr11g0489471 [Helianthus annuus]
MNSQILGFTPNIPATLSRRNNLSSLTLRKISLDVDECLQPPLGVRGFDKSHEYDIFA